MITEVLVGEGSQMPRSRRAMLTRLAPPAIVSGMRLLLVLGQRAG